MNAAILAAGALVGTGITLIIRGWTPPDPPLADILTQRHQPPTPPTHIEAGDPHQWGWSARLGSPAANWLARTGLPTPRIRADLDLMDRPIQVHLAEQATTAIIGAGLAPAVTGILALAGVSLGWVAPAWACLLLAAAGFLTPDLVTRANANARRTEFTHALGSFLDLVVIGLAGGAGVEAALTEAARIGHGWAFDRLGQALQVAEITRTAPWTTLADLGEDLQIPALREVAAAVALAGTEGAKVRASLAAKASGLRLRELTAAEATAVAATEQMSLPVIVMFAGFLVFIGYPAVTHVFTAL